MTKKKAYVIGTNVSSSLSPSIFEFWFKKYNVNAKYNHKEIKEENFDKEIHLLRNEKDLVGFNITTPYKEKIENYLDDSWYEYNDTGVREVDESQLLKQKPYCLFYRRL